MRTAIQALQDIKKMRRVIKMRESTDPAEVASILDTVLREVIMVRESTGGRIGANAIRELRDIRSDMIAGQIDVGQNSGRMIAKYSIVLDELDKVNDREARGGGGLPIPTNFDLSSIVPSSESLISALITANPILGYTTKIARDFFSGMSERRQREEERIQQTLQEAKRKAELYESELNALESVRESSESGEFADPEQEANYDILTIKLEAIFDEIKRLNDILNQNLSGNIERVSETSEEGNELLERIGNNQEEELERLENDSRNNSLLERENQLENNSSPDLIDAIPLGDSGNGFGGMLAGFGAAAGRILAPFLGMFAFLKLGGSLLVGVKFAAVSLALSGIIGFFDGLFNAAEIVGKEDVSIPERLQAATASMITGLLKPINWILGFFGMDFIDDYDEFTKTVYKKIDALTTLISTWFTDRFSFLIDTTENVIEEFKEFFDDPKTYIGKLSNYISESIDNFIIDTKNLFSGILDSFKNSYDDIKTSLSNYINDKIDNFKSFFGFEDDLIEDEKNSDDWKKSFNESISFSLKQLKNLFFASSRLVDGLISFWQRNSDDPEFKKSFNESIEKMFSDIDNFAIDAIESILSKITEMFESLKESVGNFIKSQTDKIKSFFGVENQDEKIKRDLEETSKIIEEENKKIPEQLVEVRKNLASEIVSRTLYGESNTLQSAINSGIVSGQNMNKSTNDVENLLINNNNTNNTINNTTLQTSRKSSFNSDPSQRRRSYQYNSIKYN